MVQTIRGKRVLNKFKGICGGYVIIDSETFGINTQKLSELKKRLTGAKYELIKK